jgi:uncharacterized protein (UPF0335 family)
MNAVAQQTEEQRGADVLELSNLTGDTPSDQVISGAGENDGMGDSEEEKEQRSKSRETRMAEAGATELQKTCAEAIKEIGILETRRSEINSSIQVIRERLEAQGISKKALSIVIQIGKMNEDSMDGFDTSFLILRKSISLPMQSDMFNVNA